MDQCPEWMQLGFELFSRMSQFTIVHEVFPSATYQMMQHDKNASLNIKLQGFASGVKDMLDAHVAAYTVREFSQGRGQEVGNGDGLGTIVLPRPIANPILEVLQWPS